MANRSNIKRGSLGKAESGFRAKARKDYERAFAHQLRRAYVSPAHRGKPSQDQLEALHELQGQLDKESTKPRTAYGASLEINRCLRMLAFEEAA